MTKSATASISCSAVLDSEWVNQPYIYWIMTRSISSAPHFKNGKKCVKPCRSLLLINLIYCLTTSKIHGKLLEKRHSTPVAWPSTKGPLHSRSCRQLVRKTLNKYLKFRMRPAHAWGPNAPSHVIFYVKYARVRGLEFKFETTCLVCTSFTISLTQEL